MQKVVVQQKEQLVSKCSYIIFGYKHLNVHSKNILWAAFYLWIQPKKFP